MKEERFHLYLITDDFAVDVYNTGPIRPVLKTSAILKHFQND